MNLSSVIIMTSSTQPLYLPILFLATCHLILRVTFFNLEHVLHLLIVSSYSQIYGLIEKAGYRYLNVESKNKIELKYNQQKICPFV